MANVTLTRGNIAQIGEIHQTQSEKQRLTQEEVSWASSIQEEVSAIIRGDTTSDLGEAVDKEPEKSTILERDNTVPVVIDMTTIPVNGGPESVGLLEDTELGEQSEIEEIWSWAKEFGENHNKAVAEWDRANKELYEVVEQQYTELNQNIAE